MYNTVLVTDKGDTYGVGYNYYGGLATGNTTGTKQTSTNARRNNRNTIKNIKNITSNAYLTIAVKNDEKKEYM